MFEEAVSLHQKGELAEAELLYKEVLAREPQNANALHFLGVLEGQRKNLRAAIELIDRSLALVPDNATFLFNRGYALQNLRALEEALLSYDKALAIDPAYVEALYNRGTVLHSLDRREQALESFERALAIRPDYAPALNDRGAVFLELHRVAEAEESFRSAMAAKPSPAYHSNLIFALNFDPEATTAIQQAERSRWHERHAQAFAPLIPQHTNDPDPNRRLRIGYVSSNLRYHAAALAFGGVILGHDPSQFDVICYSDSEKEDDASAQLRARVHKWHRTASLSDEQLAELIRADGIDILVDCVGHMSGDRLSVFARKPAPIQVTAWGEPTGTGLKTMDYLFADPVLVPMSERPLLAEQVFDLPNFLGYWAPDKLPEPAPLPALSNGYVTFGSFNRFSKIQPAVLRSWAAILRSVPRSRLMLKCNQLFVDPSQRKLIENVFDEEGVERERVTFLARCDRTDHLPTYQQIDIALDPFPHGGGMTTLDALWMGVPVVTFPGRTISSRLAAANLTALGLTDFIATNVKTYVKLAIAKAGDLDALSQLRSSLRERVASSPFGDAKRYAGAVETAYREMWRRWCADSRKKPALRADNKNASVLKKIDALLKRNPLHAAAWNDRGNVLMELKRADEAIVSLERAIELDPEMPEAWNNRGNALSELMRLDESLSSYRRAIALKPNYPDAFNNRAAALVELNRFDEALESYDQAVALRPDYAKAYKNRGMTKLLKGNYREGWADYEWRVKVKGFFIVPPKLDAPYWSGTDISGRSIVIFAEQGLGDIIQFARYLPLLAARGAQVTFLAPAKLHRLLRGLSPEIELIATLPRKRSFDFQCPLISLPHRFGSDATSIPNAVPYLAAEPKRVLRWKNIIGEPGFKIGIAWQALPAMDRGRSFPLAELVALARIPGVRLISLQKHHGLDQLAQLPEDAAVETLGNEFDEGPNAFVDTAAVMNSLDLVISPDTSIAHLAGALARPCWIALKAVPDWRWLLDRKDSPWYPTLRLFRQSAACDWNEVFLKMARDLQNVLGVRRADHIQPSGAPNDVLESIRKRLDAGETSWAISELKRLIESGARGPDTYRLLAVAYLKTGAADEARLALGHVRQAGTNAATEVSFGRFLNAQGHREAALDCFLSALEIDGENEDALALICMHYASEHKPELALPYGQKSLEARDRQSSALQARPVARSRPKPFNANTPNRNIIAISLFGKNPFYWDCAIASASMAFAIFPEWRCRFFCDRSVPESVRNTLLRLKSQIYVGGETPNDSSGLLWRFLAFDDPEVDVVMVRDVDSPFTVRERLAVDEWLASDFPFHVIRDHLYHCEPMLAGLWGGWTKLLPPMSSLINAHKNSDPDRYRDQKFLRMQVWPRIRQATLVHDRHFNLGETRRPPSHPTEAYSHIGMGWPRAKP